jgi:hypothetical protein
MRCHASTASHEQVESGETCVAAAVSSLKASWRASADWPASRRARMQAGSSAGSRCRLLRVARAVTHPCGPDGSELHPNDLGVVAHFTSPYEDALNRKAPRSADLGLFPVQMGQRFVTVAVFPQAGHVFLSPMFSITRYPFDARAPIHLLTFVVPVSASVRGGARMSRLHRAKPRTSI